MNVKLRKVIKEIEKNEKLLHTTQDNLKALYKEKTDLENLDMVDFLRKNKISHNDLQSIVDLLHDERGDIIPLKTENKENLEVQKDEEN
ncbi:MAG: DUF4315 family protein [Lachnospirales bacterium]